MKIHLTVKIISPLDPHRRADRASSGLNQVLFAGDESASADTIFRASLAAELRGISTPVKLPETRAFVVSNFADLPGLERTEDYPHYPGHVLALAKLDNQSLVSIKLYHPRKEFREVFHDEWYRVREPLWYVPREWPPISRGAEFSARESASDFILPSLWPSGKENLVKVIYAVEEELLIRDRVNEITMTGPLRKAFIAA